MVVDWIFELEEDDHLKKVRQMFTSSSYKMIYDMAYGQTEPLSKIQRKNVFATYKYIYLQEKEKGKPVMFNQKKLVEVLEISKSGMSRALFILCYGKVQLLHQKVGMYFRKNQEKPTLYKKITLNKAKAL